MTNHKILSPNQISLQAGILSRIEMMDGKNKFKIQIPDIKIGVLSFVICALSLFWISCPLLCHYSFAQEDDIEYALDINGNTISLPKIFLPNIDLSGRGFHKEIFWPQSLAASEVLDCWQKDIGFGSIYRLQYNLWEISQLSRDKELQTKLLANYEDIIKRISEAGGVVILNIFSTPAGLGKVLDKKSPPLNFKFFKQIIKNYIRELSCKKRYNVWYEVWSAPEVDDFFLGRQHEYLNLYKAIAESVKELGQETKIHIPVGGPSVSWWFKNFEGNTIITPQRSLIYELIKFCYRYKLPLDFISWHAYTTDPKVEKEITTYNKSPAALIRDWLSYFHFPKDIPLIVDEWNYDSGSNLSVERKEKSYICASYIPARLKNMYEAGINYQLFFSLEDFGDNKEGIVRNVGAFWFEQGPGYKGGAKSIYNAFKMLGLLGNNMFLPQTKLNDEFVGVIPTKTQDRIVLLIYNYIDPEIFKSYLSRNIALLSSSRRRALLGIVKSDKLDKIMRKELDVSTLHLPNKVKTLLKKAEELNNTAEKFKSCPRAIKLVIKNLKRLGDKSQGSAESASSKELTDIYLYERYTVDERCGLGCDFLLQEEKEITTAELYQETLILNPYSLNLVVLKRKPKEPQKPTVTEEISTEDRAKEVNPTPSNTNL